MENLNINEELSNFENRSEKHVLIEAKLDELVELLHDTPLDNNAIQGLHEKFNAGLRAAAGSTAVQPYSRTSRRINPEDVDVELEQLLFINNLDKRSQRKHSVSKVAALVIRILIALLLILLGFGMIIMPAPPYFEMFTLFYLSPNDGVTIMDVISLIVAFTGIYLLISTLTRLAGK